MSDVLDQLLEAFPGARLEPTFTSGVLLSCAHCGNGCTTYVEGEHEVWRAATPARPARVVMVTPRTPVHRWCWRDWVEGETLAAPAEPRRRGAWARRGA